MTNFDLYKLIWERFVASQMAPAILDTVTCRLNNNGMFSFVQMDPIVKFPGFMKVYVEGKDDQVEEKDKMLLPDLEVGETVIFKRYRTETTFHTAAAAIY